MEIVLCEKRDLSGAYVGGTSVPRPQIQNQATRTSSRNDQTILRQGFRPKIGVIRLARVFSMIENHRIESAGWPAGRSVQWQRIVVTKGKAIEVASIASY